MRFELSGIDLHGKLSKINLDTISINTNLFNCAEKLFERESLFYNEEMFCLHIQYLCLYLLVTRTTIPSPLISIKRRKYLSVSPPNM